MNLNRMIQQLKAYRRVPDWEWVGKIVDLGIGLGTVSYDRTTGRITLKPLSLSLAKGKHDFLLQKRGLSEARSLQRNADAKFYLNENDELIAEVEGIKAIIQTEEEITILEEIYLQGCYNLIYDKPAVVWDIGMNVGLASLYLASSPNVVAVFSYEPFKATYQQALRNIYLNPAIASKIQPFSYGVGGQKETITVDYTPEMRGSVGVNGLPDRFKQKHQSVVKEAIEIESASIVLDSIRAQYPDLDIIAKIDCEGSEYDIFRTLHAEGKLGSIRAIMMEWHQKGPDALVNDLRKAGFVIFSRRPKSKTIGLIHAVRVGDTHS
jgi:FkbM family methyltransferase